MPEFNNVDVENPRIVAAIKNMVKEGRTREDICRVVGMPHEVVESIEHRVKKESK